MEFRVLETDRLYLRNITIYDAEDMFEYWSRDVVTRYLGKKTLKSIDEVYEIMSIFEKNYAEKRGMRWGIVLKENNKLIGTMGYDAIHIKNKRADIGYDINSDYWRQGIATEAMTEIVRFGFEELGLNRIGSVVFPENIASSNLLKKIGFKEEGVLREYIIQNNIAKDTTVFSLLKREYIPDKFFIDINQIQPSQLYINKSKIERLSINFKPLEYNQNLPLPIKKLNEDIILTDGHTRAYIYNTNKVTHIPVYWDEDKLDIELYQTCVNWCKEEGIRCIADLDSRVISNDEYNIKWINRCEKLCK